MERSNRSSRRSGIWRRNRGKDTESLRKGPWKAEEDEVLLSHVRRHGPRDWSSIRSNGLLQRTGKSCRLRWVNKLRPDLKNGCKFSGRTDNDVKNFWSSRQKRLARILHVSSSSSSSTASSSRQRKNKRKIPASPNAPQVLEGIHAKYAQCRPTNQGYDPMSWRLQMPPPDVIDTAPLLAIPQTVDDSKLLHPDFTNVGNLQEEPQPHSSCHDFSNLQSGFPFRQDSQSFLQILDDPEFFSFIGPEAINSSQFSANAAFLQSSGVSQSNTANTSIDDAAMSGHFLDDLPSCKSDQFEQLPSPSRW